MSDFHLPPPATTASSRDYYSPLSGAEDTAARHALDNASITSHAPFYASYAPSIAPSESASVRPIPHLYNLDRDPDAPVAPKWGPGSKYGYKNEEEYIAALTAWAEEKKYMYPASTGEGLEGFYGTKTMGDYIAEGRPLSSSQGGFRERMRRRSSAGREQGQGRKKSLLGNEGVIEEDAVAEDQERDRERERTEEDEVLVEEGDVPRPLHEGRRRRSSLGNFLRRVRTGERVPA